VDRGLRRLGGPGYDVVEAALSTINRHKMLTGGEKVLVALSGGPDSTCLLDILWRLEDRLELAIEVAHIDHGLAERSAEVAGRVARTAAESGFEVHIIRAPDLTGPNLHARARDFRYGFLETVAQNTGADRIATGHTLDDRVETTLARLVHGAPPETLAGIPPLDGMRMRPLIDTRRGQTRAYCEAVGLEFDDDPANEDPRFERVVVRNRLLAGIEEQWGDGAVRAVARSAEYLRQDSAALDELSDRLYRELARATTDGVRFERSALGVVPRALRRRLVERAVGRVRDRSGGIEAALDALEGEASSGARFAVAGGVEIEVDGSDLVVRRPAAGDEPDQLLSRDEP
jgi:tRNA(Ile)-lysidine synthase